MKRKYKIFLSSTFKDFEDARIKLILQTLKLGHIPAGMELFKAGDARNLDVIEADISSSDIFVILVGARLGSLVSDDEQLTFVMREYELATKYGLPIIPFLLADSEDDREPLLKRFTEEVQLRAEGGRRIAGFFTYNNFDRLCAEYGDALHEETERLAAKDAGGGWVEGTNYDQLRARITLGASASTNTFFQRFADRLSTFDKLSKRTAIEPRSKSAIADYFWEQYMPRIDEREIDHIYFESGSAIAFASRSFIEYVREEDWFYERKLDSRLHLRTNNILTYLEFLLIKPPWRPMDIQLLPYGPFSHDYGATYGRLKSTRKINSPRTADETYIIPQDAAEEIEDFVKSASESFSGSGIVLMTTSGVDIAQDSPFPGPHVGSPYNMLLKRCLISLPCPKVMFLDAKKWNYPFRFNNCHPVCNLDNPWETVKSSTPLAIAVAVDTKHERENLSQSLKDNGFSHQEQGEVLLGEDSVWPIIAGNELFANYFR